MPGWWRTDGLFLLQGEFPSGFICNSFCAYELFVLKENEYGIYWQPIMHQDEEKFLTISCINNSTGCSIFFLSLIMEIIFINSKVTLCFSGGVNSFIPAFKAPLLFLSSAAGAEDKWESKCYARDQKKAWHKLMLFNVHNTVFNLPPP